MYYGNTVQSGEHVTPGLSSFLEKRAPAQPAPRVQTHSFPRRLRGGRERRECTTLAVGFFAAQLENREGVRGDAGQLADQPAECLVYDRRVPVLSSAVKRKTSLCWEQLQS